MANPSFTADQIKTMSSEYLKIPGRINDPGTGYIDQKATYVALGSNFLSVDGIQKTFSDAWIAAHSAYHAELTELDLEIRTSYTDALIVAGAQQTRDPSSPFPPTWPNINPKLLPSNLGNPVTTSTSLTEVQKIAKISAAIALLKTGFTGSASFTGTISAGVITTLDDTTGVVVGTELLFNQTSSAFFATVVSITPVSDPGDPMHVPPIAPSTTTTIVVTLIAGTPVDGVYNADANFPGFTNAQRSGTSSLSPNANAYAVIKAQIQTDVTAWQSSLNAEKAALNANTDLVNGAHVATALVNVNAALSSITTWAALTDLVVNGLLTNNGLSPMESQMTARNTAAPARVTQIIADLGTVSQNPDGSYSGTGAYLELFKLVVMRAQLGLGTLTKYYDNLRNQGTFDLEIAQANDQLAQYTAVMYVSKILANTVAGQDTFTVDTVAGLTVGDTVAVMDDSSISYARTISQIVGTSVKVNTGIPIILTAKILARIVKLK